MSMNITRKFLGCDRPALASAADYLFTEFGQSHGVDLTQVVVVVPGRRAGRRLLEMMLEEAERRQVAFTPPVFETIGRLPERLYEPQRPFANDLVQLLAWTDVLRSATPEVLAPVFGPLAQQSEESLWEDLGETLRQEHLELARETLDFSDVLRAGQQIEGFGETERWQCLATLQRAYLDRLDALQLWDRETARLVAIEKNECVTDQHIVLLGTVDVGAALRSMLAQVAAQVTALVFAPSGWADRFDAIGCIRPEIWKAAEIEICEEQVHVVDAPLDQVERVARCLAEYEGRYSAEQITIGVPNAALVPQLQRQLEQCDVPTRWGSGTSIWETGPFRLLQKLADYLESERFQDLAALVRHPDVTCWLQTSGIQGDYLTAFDEFHAQHLPYRLDFDVAENRQRSSQVEEVAAAMNWPLNFLKGTDRRLDEWVEPLLRLMTAIYGQRTLDRDVDRDRTTLLACEQIRDGILGLRSIPEELAPRRSAAEAIRLALKRASSATVPQVRDEAAIELLGWLELPLDDAPVMVVTNMNEGFVPSAVNSDLFLPNTIRQQLGLLDNDRRIARDAYALAVLLASRQSLDLIVGRTTSDGDPLRPSRLLFATDPERVAQRALLFLKPATEGEARYLEDALTATRETAAFSVPRPVEQPPITSLSVTQFKDYLACPCRFYLKHVLRLGNMADDADEMDGGLFGSLLHEVLTRFGHSPARDSTDPQEIEDVLSRALDECAREQFGKFPVAAVRLQVEQARLRLRLFAEQQAVRAEEGWQIVYTEPLDAAMQGGKSKRIAFPVDGEDFEIRGRIDRIDQHRTSGQRIIFDYKTGDTAPKPGDALKKKKNEKQKHWNDLQLPLYRHLDEASSPDSVQLGYIVLPKDSGGVEFRVAEWTAEELEAADEVARDVIRGIRQQTFWPPADPPPDYSDAWAAICLD